MDPRLTARDADITTLVVDAGVNAADEAVQDGCVDTATCRRADLVVSLQARRLT